MAQVSQPMSIAQVRRYLERADRHGSAEATILPFGVPELDNRLPHGGLPRGHLHEAIEAGAASQSAGLATLFVAGILADAISLRPL
jgi:protein ImuA